MSAAASEAIDLQACALFNVQSLLDGIRAIEAQAGRDGDSCDRLAAVAGDILHACLDALYLVRDNLARAEREARA